MFKDSNPKDGKHIKDRWDDNALIFKRRPLPKGIRHEVFIRDHYKCTECGAGKEKYSLEVDHIVSISKGGTDEMSNLRTLCEPCNREKNDLVHNGGSVNKSEDNGYIRKDFGWNIEKCPECGFDYNHPISVIVQKKDEEIKITDQKNIIINKEENKTRGVQIKIMFKCEEGHLWIKTYQFHKGQTLYRNNVPDIQLTQFGLDQMKTIWRD